MPTYNTTGKSSSDNYNVGRGIVYAAPLDTAGYPTVYRDLGNAPAFTCSLTTEDLEHFSSRGGLRTQDKTIVVSQEVELGFTLEEWVAENLELVFTGEGDTAGDNASILGFTPRILVGESVLRAGRWYDIVNSTRRRAYDIIAGNLSVELGASTLVNGVDYDLDAEFGRIFLRADSATVTAGIAGNNDLEVTLAADAGAKTTNEVRGFTKTSSALAIKFIQENAVNGNKTEFQFHQVSLQADGEIALISDEWGQLSFTGTTERNEVVEADSPYLTIRSVRAR